MTWLLPPAARYTTAEHGKPHEQIVSRATLYEMFGPDGSDRMFFCKACENVLATTPAEKEKIQRGLAQGSLCVPWLFETAGGSRGQFVELSRADYNPNWNPPMAPILKDTKDAIDKRLAHVPKRRLVEDFD